MAPASLLFFSLVAGMIAAFNPCGFAMLPAYLIYFVGSDPDKESTNRAKNILRALVVGLTMSLAFLLLFGAFGLVTSHLFSQGDVKKYLQWATFVLGLLMVPLGVWLILGKEINLKIPRLQKGGKENNLVSIFLFGVSFAIVSLGCSSPVFLVALLNSFREQGWFASVQVFLAYGAGLSLIVLFLTLATGMARTEVAVLMKKIIPHIGKISGAFLVLAGIYLAIYGWWEIRIIQGALSNNWLDIAGNWLSVESEKFRRTIEAWIQKQGAGRLGIAIGILVGIVMVWASTDSTETTSEQEQKQLKVWRYSLIGVLVAGWLVLEIVRYEWRLLLLPIWNFIIDLPSRVWEWIVHPLRWSVPFEVLFAAFIVLIVVLNIRKRLRNSRQKQIEPENAPLEETAETSETKADSGQLVSN